MVIDHIGIVVGSMDEGIRQWTECFGYQQSSDVVENSRQKVKVVFLSKPGSTMIKLIEPTQTTGPVSAFSRRGGGLHHLCMRCDNIADGIAELKESGAALIVSPQPGEAFQNHDIAFLLAPGGLNIELIDTTVKAVWRDAE